MLASAWTNGRSTYGINVGRTNRKRFFSPNAKVVNILIDGQAHQFRLSPSFWNSCPEIRDSGQPVIRQWLERNNLLSWPLYEPARVNLLPVSHNTYRLELVS